MRAQQNRASSQNATQELPLTGFGLPIVVLRRPFVEKHSLHRTFLFNGCNATTIAIVAPHSLIHLWRRIGTCHRNASCLPADLRASASAGETELPLFIHRLIARSKALYHITHTQRYTIILIPIASVKTLTSPEFQTRSPGPDVTATCSLPRTSFTQVCIRRVPERRNSCVTSMEFRDAFDTRYNFHFPHLLLHASSLRLPWASLPSRAA